MSVERRKVLDMLMNGKITAEEADRLLDKLTPTILDSTVSSPALVSQEDSPTGHATPRFLRVEVNGNDDRVDIRIPLKLISTGIKLQAMMPRGASEELESRGIDLREFSKMDTDELINALGELTVDVTGKKETVRIYCE
ncbi:MAG: hypothetical protein QGI68_19215 [Pseudomonadales bacterium]|jgi:hypothetical protein|nr:hypothetical protein [Pseudomonadales bacterium]MDP7360767.1 hypothetical protein [Pseudomonadales bacterium]MDP7597674.1 hypothetical protein [Pseudomonadales bacterium]HJN50640.1 hypothetical protein [Pseudomonadales bacterium]|tara:strand:+ start:235 stop:651 length:417 start_codon:yes stop_codon:yes gene_type:complete